MFHAVRQYSIRLARHTMTITILPAMSKWEGLAQKFAYILHLYSKKNA